MILRCSVLAVLLFTTAVVRADSVVPRGRVVNGVNVRQQASSDSPIVGFLRPGESLEFIKSVPRWYKVRVGPAEAGFVSKSFTLRLPQPEGAAPLPARGTDELRIHYLAVGTGTCTVVECPGAGAVPMIIDCGSRGRAPNGLDDGQLTSRVDGILAGRVPNVVLSHADQDHINRIAMLLEGRPIGQVWLGGASDEYPQDLRDLLADAGTTINQDLADDFHDESPLTDEQLDCGDASVFVLTVNTGGSKNSQSLVMSIDYGEFSAIFSGDAEGKTERQARRNFDDAVRTNVLSGSHHGADTHGSNGTRRSEWPEFTRPEVIIYSAGNTFEHPRCGATQNYVSSLARVPAHAMRCGRGNGTFRQLYTTRAEYTTSVSGTIVVTTSGVSPMSIWCEQSASCAATIAF